MNNRLMKRLQREANYLTQAEQNNNLRGMLSNHAAIRQTVADIYKDGCDIPSVMKVEKIIFEGQINKVEKSKDAYKRLAMLVEKAEIGMKAHASFTRLPSQYVQCSEAVTEKIPKHRPDGIPLEPIRSPIEEFRKELVNQLTQTTTEMARDRTATSRTRLDGIIRAERQYLEQYIDHKQGMTREEKGREKQQVLKLFEARMKRQLEKAAPTQGRKVKNRSQGQALQ
jgi:hypothetical protein